MERGMVSLIPLKVNEMELRRAEELLMDYEH